MADILLNLIYNEILAEFREHGKDVLKESVTAEQVCAIIVRVYGNEGLRKMRQTLDNENEIYMRMGDVSAFLKLILRSPRFFEVHSGRIYLNMQAPVEKKNDIPSSSGNIRSMMHKMFDGIENRQSGSRRTLNTHPRSTRRLNERARLKAESLQKYRVHEDSNTNGSSGMGKVYQIDKPSISMREIENRMMQMGLNTPNPGNNIYSQYPHGPQY